MRPFLFIAAGLHAAFMICELFPSVPVLLGIVSKKLPKLPPDNKPFTPQQQELVATIVRNAGLYNGIVAGGLLWATCGGHPDVAHVMLVGAVVAGTFGTVTLKSPVPAVQAIVGIIGLTYFKL